MKIVIDIPKEFEEHFKSDRFEDSLARVASDIESFGFQLAGRYEKETITMLRKAIKNGTPLPEQQPCEDCISRQAVKEMLTGEWTKYMPMGLDMNLSFVLEKISELPSVTPKYIDEEIDRAQAVEQAYIDKMVELTVEEWCKNGRK